MARASIEGPQVVLTPSATQGIALVIHELATNAAKYGALSTPGGKVTIRWSVENRGDEPWFSFNWQESGGPRVTPPEASGFGTTLLKGAISGADAASHIEYAPEGVHFTVKAPLSAVAVPLEQAFNDA